MIKHYLNIPIIFLLTLIVFNSCKNNNKPQENNIIPFKRITEFKDNTYFSLTEGMVFYKDKIYIPDNDNGTVWITDEDFNLLSHVGRYGKGPGEMTYCSKVAISGNYILASDEGNRKINFYDINNNTFINSFKISFPGYSIDSRFAVSNNQQIYISTRNKIYSEDFSGKLINEIKLVTKSYWYKNKKIIGNRHVLIFDNKYLILVVENEPIIEMFSFTGEFINKYDLSGLECLSNLISFINNGNKPRPLTYYSFFVDAYLVGNSLYILYLDILKNDEKTNGNIMEFEISKKYCNLKNIYHLFTDKKIGWYESFCISDDKKKIYAYEAINNELQIFPIK